MRLRRRHRSWCRMWWRLPDAGECGAEGGLSTVDGALTIMLQVFGQVMHEHVLTPYMEGVASEAAAMDAIAQDYQAVEADSAQLAAQAGK